MTEKQKDIIKKTADFVKVTLSGSEGGHDWWHVYRVWKTAQRIARKERADMFTVSLGALLHDIADAKFYDGDESVGPETARKFLIRHGVDDETINGVIHIIKYVSFKNRNDAAGKLTPELAAVQDADRLDAMGAIGIARAFNYGGFKNRPLYDPEIPPKPEQTKEEYKKSTAPTVNHFYEKLLLLKDLMNTAEGKRLAEERHRFMEEFLDRFFTEWNGKGL